MAQIEDLLQKRKNEFEDELRPIFEKFMKDTGFSNIKMTIKDNSWWFKDHKIFNIDCNYECNFSNH